MSTQTGPTNVKYLNQTTKVTVAGLGDKCVTLDSNSERNLRSVWTPGKKILTFGFFFSFTFGSLMLVMT